MNVLEETEKGKIVSKEILKKTDLKVKEVKSNDPTKKF